MGILEIAAIPQIGTFEGGLLGFNCPHVTSARLPNATMLEIMDFCASVQNVKLKVGTQFLKRNELKKGNSFNCLFPERNGHVPFLNFELFCQAI